jgi:hypothetical protein
MVQVFESTVRSGFSSDEIDMMREAYRVAVETLQLEGFAERRQVAMIVQKLESLSAFPAPRIWRTSRWTGIGLAGRSIERLRRRSPRFLANLCQAKWPSGGTTPAQHQLILGAADG